MTTPTELRDRVQTFVRRFGLLVPDRTPCGQPLPVSEAHALMWLADRPAPPTQRALTEALGIDKSNVARLCARMEAAGHLERRRCTEDGRARRLHLTPAGSARAATIDIASRARFAELLEAIPADARSAVIAALDALNIATDTLSGDDPCA